MINKKYLS